MAVLAGGAAWRESATIDEVIHIGAGVSYVQKLDLRLNEEHPPLAKVLAATPAVLTGARADYSDHAWTVSRNFFPGFLGQLVFGERVLHQWNEPRRTLAWMRLPMLLLTLALGWGVYVYGRRLGGDWGGLLCLSVYATMPLFLTFGPLVHTDLAVTLFTLLALWMFGEVWRDPSRKNVLLFGLSLAGALLSKFTACLLFLAFAALAMTLWWRVPCAEAGNRAEVRTWRRRRWRASWRGILWAFLAVYIFYLVFSWNQPTDSLAFVGQSPAAMAARRILMPVWLYLRGMLMVVLTASRPTFILGHAYPHGVWFYFPVLLVLKSPLGFLGLLVMAGAGALAGRSRLQPVINPKAGLHWRLVWVSLAVYVAACLASRVNIGFRHFSIPLVLLILLLAPLPRLLGRLPGRRVLTALATGLAAACLITAAWAYPFYFPYVNALRMGRPAYQLFADSNLDWGQALPEARRFAQERGIQALRVDAFTFSDPKAIVPQAEWWSCQTPSEADAGQWAVVSVNQIRYMENCAWLMRYPHETLAGGSLYAVRLPSPIPPPGSPGGPPLPSDQLILYRGLHGEDSRAMVLDLIRHPERMPAAAAETQRIADEYNAKALAQFPWLKKRLAESGP